MKTCNICKITRELTEFYTKWQRNWKVRYLWTCKYCTRIQRNNAYKDKYITIKWVIIPQETEYKTKLLERSKSYYEINKERIKQQKRDRYNALSLEEKKALNTKIDKNRKKRVAKQKLEMIKQKRLLLNENIC